MASGLKYHISLNDDGKWQVKGEKADKALKLFATQAEAIAYAKKVAGNQEGNIVIHKVDGKIRKQDYGKKPEADNKQKSAPKSAAPAKTNDKKADAKSAAPAKASDKKKADAKSSATTKSSDKKKK